MELTELLFFAPQGSYTGFVYTYAVGPPMSLTHKMAGYLTSVFWAAITVGRLAAIPLSYCVKPVRLLTFNQVREKLASHNLPSRGDTNDLSKDLPP